MEHELTFKIPSVDKIEQAIDKFNQINWDLIDINNLDKEIDPILFALHLFIIGEVKPPKFVFRSRGLSTFTIKDNICSLDSFKYPPKDVCPMNRLNLDNTPVFYSSVDLRTALVECDTPDSVYFISRWKFIQ